MTTTRRASNTPGNLERRLEVLRLVGIERLSQGELSTRLGIGLGGVASLLGRIGRRYLGRDHRPGWEHDLAAVGIVLLGLADQSERRATGSRLVDQVERLQAVAERARSVAEELMAEASIERTSGEGTTLSGTSTEG